MGPRGYAMFGTAYIALPGVTLKRIDDTYHFICSTNLMFREE
jgi:hypothetical protein